jgi:glycosyltransferase involved in cell wall biosynthesis
MQIQDVGISISLTTYNGVKRLYNTLLALSNLSIDKFKFVELIVIDNASEDDTSEFVEKTWRELGNKFVCKLINLEVNNLTLARKTGMDLAKGDLVITCDDDNSFHSNYLEIGVKYFLDNPKIGVLGGQGRIISEVSVPSWFERYAYYYGCAPQAEKTGNVYPERNVVYGAGMWHRNSAYQKISNAGFKYLMKSREIGKLGCGDDSELCWAFKFAGYEVWYAEDLVFDHHITPHRLTEAYLEQLLNYHGINGPYTNLHYRIFSNQITSVKLLFWLREIAHYFLYLIKSPFVIPKNKLKSEFNRVIQAIKILWNDKSEYDKNVQFLIDFKKNLD